MQLPKCEYYYSYDGGGVDVFQFLVKKKYYIAYKNWDIESGKKIKTKLHHGLLIISLLLLIKI